MGNDLLKKVNKEKIVFFKIIYRGRNDIKYICLFVVYEELILLVDVIDYFCDVVNVFKF